MPSLKLSNLFRRAADRPSLRERAASLKAGLARLAHRRPPEEADPGRRAVMGGALAAAVPLPALAAPAIARNHHPDQALLDAGKALETAREAQRAAEDAYRVANHATYQVLATRPAALLPLTREYRKFSTWPVRPEWRDVKFRWVPSGDEAPAPDQWSTVVWTGAGLRHIIERAVPVLGRGGQTPHRIRRWRALLPVADAFDSRAKAIEAATDYHRLKAAREAAREAVTAARTEVERYIATTPEGMAVLVRLLGSGTWRDQWGAWPALLISAAHVAGIDPASLDHEYASTRHLRA